MPMPAGIGHARGISPKLAAKSRSSRFMSRTTARETYSGTIRLTQTGLLYLWN
jgi:hypothetical protein